MAAESTPTSFSVDIKFRRRGSTHTSTRQRQESSPKRYDSALQACIQSSLVSDTALAAAALHCEMSTFHINHRRTTSLPAPPDFDPSGSGESDDGESFILPCEVEQRSRSATAPDQEMSNQDSCTLEKRDSIMSTEETETTSVFVDVAELLHSPSLNRRSVSVFHFGDLEPHSYPSTDDSYHQLSTSTPMSSSFMKKIQHLSTSSTESLRDDSRTLVLKELLQTERRYITSLETLLSVFLSNLETIVSPRDLRLLFPCQLEPLIVMHRDLLSRLEERIEGMSRWHGIIGDVFGRLCSDKEGEFVALYSAYMNEFKIAMQTLVHYENTSPLFCKIVSNCSQQPGCEGLSLAAFLLTPIQRIPRYELLLKTLLKHTSGDHPDCYYIEAALDTIHRTLVLLDRSIQACQLAVTVNQVKDEGRGKKPSRRANNRRRKRYNSSRIADKIRRHLSQTNIDDFAPHKPDKEIFTRPSSVLEKSSHLARSVSDLLIDKNEYQKKREAQSGYLNRAISFSDVLLLDSDDTVHEECLVPNNDRALNMSRSPSIASHDSIEAAPASILNTQRASIYSSNSSTSGFDSLGGDYSCGLEDTGTLKPSHSMTAASNVSTLKPSRQLSSMNSTDSGYREETKPVARAPTQPVARAPTQDTPKQKKRVLSNAFKVFRRSSTKDHVGNSPLTRDKRSSSLGQLNKVTISQPTDFRHIEHKTSPPQRRRISTVL